MRRLLGLGSIAVIAVAAPIAFAACGNAGSPASSPDGGAATSSSGGGSSGSSGGGSGSSGGGSGSGSGGGSGSSSGGGDSGVEAGVDGGTLTGASVLQFHNHINRDGFFVDSALTEAKAATFVRDTSFSGSLKSDAGVGGSGHVYASPLYAENGVNGKGTFYQATEDGNVFALDETTGAIVWQKNVAPAATNTGAGCGNISPIGITGTPAIDLATRLIVFDSAKADAANSIATHTIYALSIDTGNVTWSVDVSTLTSPSGTTFSPQPQNERGAVLIVNGVAYVAYGGHYGDCGNYHGWVVGVPLSGTGAKTWATQVAGAGIWSPGGPASDGASIFVTTGNGKGGPATWAESEGVFRLDPGPTYAGTTADYFAPYNWMNLDNGDVDLSGSGPLVIDAPSMTPSKLIMAQGKDGYLYLLDRTNLGGVATLAKRANVGALQVHSGEITNGAAWATVGGTTYVVVRPNGQQAAIGCPNGTSGDLIAVKLDPTATEKMTPVWCVASHGVGSPSITTSDGTADPMVWVFAADQGANGKLYSWDLTTGAPVFTGGAATDTGPSVRRFTTPIAVHGRIFAGGDNHLYAYKAK